MYNRVLQTAVLDVTCTKPFNYTLALIAGIVWRHKSSVWLLHARCGWRREWETINQGTNQTSRTTLTVSALLMGDGQHYPTSAIIGDCIGSAMSYLRNLRAFVGCISRLLPLRGLWEGWLAQPSSAPEVGAHWTVVRQTSTEQVHWRGSHTQAPTRRDTKQRTLSLWVKY